MPVTQAQIDAINEQIASAERQVTNGSQSVTYRSITELIAARNALQEQFDQEQIANGERKARSKQVKVFYAGRGYQR